jgi:spoIIIJ-associated protein
MKEYTFEARSEEEALQKAAGEMGVLPEDLAYEVLEKKTSGFLGMGKAVRIKVRFRDEHLPQDEEALEPGGVGGDEPPPIPVAPVASAPRAPRVRHDEADEDEAEAALAAAPAVPFDELVEPAELSERAAKAKAVATRIVAGMGLEVESRAAEDEHGITIRLRTGDDNLVIGKGGTVLDAVQFLVNKIVNRFPEDRKFVVVDVNNYRKRKSDSLERFSDEMCKKAIKTARTIRLRDLNPRERRLVHMVVARYPELSSKSVWEGEERVLMIVPGREQGAHDEE